MPFLLMIHTWKIGNKLRECVEKNIYNYNIYVVYT